jgi:hypothetical protein
VNNNSGISPDPGEINTDIFWRGRSVVVCVCVGGGKKGSEREKEKEEESRESWQTWRKECE